MDEIKILLVEDEKKIAAALKTGLEEHGFNVMAAYDGSMGLPSFLNRISYKLSDLGMKMMSKAINQFKQCIGINTKYKRPQLPIIYGISPSFLNQM